MAEGVTSRGRVESAIACSGWTPLTAVDGIRDADVVSRVGIGETPGRLGCCLSGAEGNWVFTLTDGADVCGPNAPTDGPAPLVVCGATLVTVAGAEMLGCSVVVDIFATLENEEPCALAPLTDWG